MTSHDYLILAGLVLCHFISSGLHPSSFILPYLLSCCLSSEEPRRAEIVSPHDNQTFHVDLGELRRTLGLLFPQTFHGVVCLQARRWWLTVRLWRPQTLTRSSGWLETGLWRQTVAYLSSTSPRGESTNSLGSPTAYSSFSITPVFVLQEERRRHDHHDGISLHPEGFKGAFIPTLHLQTGICRSDPNVCVCCPGAKRSLTYKTLL